MSSYNDAYSRKLRRCMHTVRTTCITSVRSSRSAGCFSQKCCAFSCTGLLLFLFLGWIAGTKYMLPVLYPEQALWVENMCKIDIFTVRNVQSDGTTSASQRERVLKHHPSLKSVIGPLEYSVRLLKDALASGPVEMQSELVVLVGMHHKTGSVLARKVFASSCLRIRQCGVFLVTSASEVDMKRTLQDSSVRLVSHPQWPWMPHQLIPTTRPYLFVHFWRNPASKLSSGYLYHKTGVERWTETFSFSAQQVCHASRDTVCDHLKICRDCCVDIMGQSRQRRGNNTRGVALHASRAQQFTCQLLKSGEGTMRELLSNRDLRGGLLVEAAMEYFETYRMAQIWNQTQGDAFTLNIELDAMMGDFPGTVDAIISFLVTGSAKRGQGQYSRAVSREQSRIKDDALVFDMGSSQSALSSLYTSIYNSPAYQHGTGGEEKAQARAEVESLLCTHPPLQTLFRPVFEMLGHGPNCPPSLLSRKWRRNLIG